MIAAEMEESIAKMMELVRSGDVRALARAVSFVEAGSHSDAEVSRAIAAEILGACFPLTGKALRIGITGAPGAGKSTLLDKLARFYRDAGRTIGVVAVDPSSPYSGGAVLGDRIRFPGFSGDPGFYARSMASRGALGGLARTTADVAAVIEASGKDIILIETVGVGQDELEIVRLADVTVVVLVPGMGDDVQSLKAGILEIADIYAINKSDREGADALESELQSAMSLGRSASGRVIPVVQTVATLGSGISELVDAIATCQGWLSLEGRLKARRAAQWRGRILDMLRGELMRGIARTRLGENGLEDLAMRVADGLENPYQAVPKLLQELCVEEVRASLQFRSDSE